MSAGVVAALSAEARTLGASAARGDGLAATADGILVAVSGMGAAAATRAANLLADAGATALVSWGLAGGLDPGLAAGTLCLPEVVVDRAGAGLLTDHHWRELVTAALVARRAVVHGKLLSSEHTIDDAAGKAAAFLETGACVVDMESYAIGSVAAVRSLPFIAIRVVVDTAADSLPESVLAASSAGEVRLLRLLQGLARSPRDIAPLVRLALRYRVARQALLSVARSGALAPLAYAATAVNRVA